MGVPPRLEGNLIKDYRRREGAISTSRRRRGREVEGLPMLKGVKCSPQLLPAFLATLMAGLIPWELTGGLYVLGVVLYECARARFNCLVLSLGSSSH